MNGQQDFVCTWPNEKGSNAHDSRNRKLLPALVEILANYQERTLPLPLSQNFFAAKADDIAHSANFTEMYNKIYIYEIFGRLFHK